MAKIAMTLCGAVLVGLAGCTTYDPYYTPNPPNPEPSAATSRATPAAPPVAVVPSAPVAAANAGVPVTTPSNTMAYRPGYGVIESVSLVYQPRTPSASTGGSISTAPDAGPYRITVRMDDGSLQSVVVDNRSFMVGDRVQLMNDGRMARM